MEEMLWAYEDTTHDDVSTSSNTANVWSDIFTVTVGDGKEYGLKDGFLLKMKLYDSTPTEIPDTSEVMISWKAPTDKEPREIWHGLYDAWGNRTWAQQGNVDYQAQIRIDLPPVMRPVAWFEDDDQILIRLKSSSVVSWASGKGSRIQFKVLKRLMGSASY